MALSNLDEASNQAHAYVESITALINELDPESKLELAKLITNSYIKGWVGGMSYPRKADTVSNNKISVPSAKPGLAVLLSNLERS